MHIEYPLGSPLDEKVQRFIRESIETSYNVQNSSYFDSKIVIDLADEVPENEFKKFIKKNIT